MALRPRSRAGCKASAGSGVAFGTGNSGRRQWLGLWRGERSQAAGWIGKLLRGEV
jgi:hypothetical protein